MEGTVLGSAGDQVSIMSVVSPHRLVSVSLLGSLLSVGYYFETFHYSFPLSLGARYIQYHFKKKMGRKRKLIKTQQEKAKCEEWRKKMRLEVRAKLVVGFGELIALESVYDNSAQQDIATVTKENEETEAKVKSNLRWKEENCPNLKK